MAKRRRYTYSAIVGGHKSGDHHGHHLDDTVVETNDPDIIKIFDQHYGKGELLPDTLDRLVQAGLSDRDVTLVTSDSHFVKEGYRESVTWNVGRLAEFIPEEMKREIETGVQGKIPDDGQPLTLEIFDEQDRRMLLTTNDPAAKFGIKYGKSRGWDMQETFRQMIASGLGESEFTYAYPPADNDPISKVIAEMYGRPRRETTRQGGKINAEGILRTFVREAERESRVRDIEAQAGLSPAEVHAEHDHADLTEEQSRKLNVAVDQANESAERSRILQEAAQELADMRKQNGPMNMKDFAAATTAIARRKGYTGKAFTEQEAQFSADAFALLKRYPNGQAEFSDLLSSFRPNTIEDAAEGRCDFCNADNPVWEYPCEDFKLDTPNGEDYRSAGAWAACERCAMSIEGNDRMSLVNRYLANKPRKFHDLVRPWGIRLQNQFFRHRSGARVRVDYRENQGARLQQLATATEEAERRAGVRPHAGHIEVMSADHPDAPPDLAARVRETGEVAMMVEDEQGNLRLVAEGDAAVHEHLERRQIAAGYQRHPLLERYMQHIHSEQTRHGLWRNTEAWHALAEKYGMTLAAATSLGIPGTEGKYGSMRFDPFIARHWDDPSMAEAMGLYITHGLHDSVPYLWTSKVDELAEEPDLPAHNITRGLAPHPAMFWSFEAAMGAPEARIDWMLVLETARGYEVWCPLADDEKRDGTVMLTGAIVPYGARWPDIAKGEKHSLIEFLLKRLSFVNSKYTETPRIKAYRAVRKEVARNIKPYHHTPPDDLGAFVIHLRAPEPKPARADAPGPGRDFERKHCWWRRAHTRILYRDKPNERPTWVRATLMGDTNLPLIRTTIVVDH